MPFRLLPLPPPLPDSRLLYMSSLDLGGRWRIEFDDILEDPLACNYDGI